MQASSSLEAANGGSFMIKQNQKLTMGSNSVLTVTGTGRVARESGGITVNCPAFGVVQGTGEGCVSGK